MSATNIARQYYFTIALAQCLQENINMKNLTHVTL